MIIDTEEITLIKSGTSLMYFTMLVHRVVHSSLIWPQKFQTTVQRIMTQAIRLRIWNIILAH